MNELASINPPLIAILRNIESSEASQVGHALIDAGIRILEVTMNSPDPLKSIEIILAEQKDKAIIGAGTVLTVEEVEAVHALGGQLIVSPNFNPQVVKRTKELGMFSCPGCLTPSEIFNAVEAGADVVKVFPGDVATPAVIKSLCAVLPKDVPLAVTGGVRLDNIATYLSAGVNSLGIGSALYKPGKSAEDIGIDAKKFIEACKS